MREIMLIPVESCQGAVFNTHRAVDDNDESIRDLAESMKNMLIQPITVRKVAEDKFEIIDGHRRVQAAKILGWNNIEAIVDVVDETQSSGMTITANLQRLDNDPLLEAEAFKNLFDRGRTIEEVAALAGKSTTFVRRRINLTNLDKKWVDDTKKYPFDVTAIERIASYDPEIQRSVYKTTHSCLGHYVVNHGRVVWSDLVQRFYQVTRDLANVPFDVSGCRKCPHNTACQGCLFPGDGDREGMCQDGKCYKKLWSDAVDKEIKALKDKKLTVNKIDYRWRIPGDTKPKKQGVYCVPYLVKDDSGTGLDRIYWSKNKPNSSSSKPAMTKEEREKAKAEKDAEKQRKADVKSFREMLAEWIKSDTFEKCLKADDYELKIMTFAISMIRDMADDIDWDNDSCRKIYEMFKDDVDVVLTPEAKRGAKIMIECLA